MKFKVGDRFQVKENGISGQIVGTQWNPNSNKEEFVVLWDFLSRKGYYPVDEVDDIWELTSTTITIKNIAGLDFIPITIQIHRGPCLDHDWVNYNGFNESYQFCKKCDEKRNV